MFKHLNGRIFAIVGMGTVDTLQIADVVRRVAPEIAEDCFSVELLQGIKLCLIRPGSTREPFV